jgi:hypothetical protein
MWYLQKPFNTLSIPERWKSTERWTTDWEVVGECGRVSVAGVKKKKTCPKSGQFI